MENIENKNIINKILSGSLIILGIWFILLALGTTIMRLFFHSKKQKEQLDKAMNTFHLGNKNIKTIMVVANILMGLLLIISGKRLFN